MRRCRQCKQHNIPKDASRSEFTCSPKCWQDYKDAQYAKKRAPKLKAAKPKKKKLKTIAKLVDEAAVLLQKLVRMKAADNNGMCRSFTSDRALHWTDMQGSHFIQRNRLATKLLEENVHPQTPGENMYDMKTATGVLDYRRAMVDYYGEEFVRWLEQESKKVKKYTRAEVEGIIFDFKRQIQEQEARLAGRALPQQQERAA